MLHNFLIIETALIPQWTRDNVPGYAYGCFSNDGKYILIDNAHPLSTYYTWLGQSPDVDNILQQLLLDSTAISEQEILDFRKDPASIWYFGEE